VACFGVTRTVVPRGADVKDVLAELGLKYDDTWKPTGRMGKRLSALLMSPSCVCRFLMLSALCTAAAFDAAVAGTAEGYLAVVLTRGLPQSRTDPAFVKALVAAAYLSFLGVSTVGDWDVKCTSGKLATLPNDLVEHVVDRAAASGSTLADPRAAAQAAAAGAAGGTGKATAARGSLFIRTGLFCKWLVGVHPPVSGRLCRF
jgi:hypothetical protein